MKKFYALAAAAVVALAANAQNGAPLYITGQSAGAEAGGFANDWNVETPDQFTFEDGVYKIHVNGLSSFTISPVIDGTWDGWKANSLTANYGDVPGVAVALVAGGDNILCPWQGDYDVVVAGDLSTITLTTDTPQPEVKVYLRGDMNGWLNEGINDELGESWRLQNVDGNIWKFECNDDQKVLVGESFKIADAGWAKYNYGSDGEAILMEVETSLFFNALGNITFEEDWNGVCWVIFDGENTMAAFSNDKAYECPFESAAVSNITVDNNEAPAYFNLQGVRVDAPESGLYIVVKGNKATKVVF